MPFELIEIAQRYFWVVLTTNGYNYVEVGHLKLEG